MTENLRIDDRLVIPEAELDLRTSRSRGPGGQHVNKAETRVELRWNVRESAVLSEGQRARILRALAGRINRDGELIVTAETHRSQHRNREEAAGRLRELVARALVRRPRRLPTRRPRAAHERRLRDKRRRAELKRQRRDPADG